MNEEYVIKRLKEIKKEINELISKLEEQRGIKGKLVMTLTDKFEEWFRNNQIFGKSGKVLYWERTIKKTKDKIRCVCKTKAGTLYLVDIQVEPDDDSRFTYKVINEVRV